MVIGYYSYNFELVVFQFLNKYSDLGTYVAFLAIASKYKFILLIIFFSYNKSKQLRQEIIFANINLFCYTIEVNQIHINLKEA